MNDDSWYDIAKNNFLEGFIQLPKEEQLSELKNIFLDLADHTQENKNEKLFYKLYEVVKGYNE